MAINTKELQKFLDVWSPIIAALPAVINATERENELENHVPLLQAELEKVQADTSAALADRALQLADADAAVRAIRADTETASVELSKARMALREGVAASQAEAEAEVRRCEERVAQAQVLVDEADEALRVKLMESDKAFLAHTNEQQAAIDALEAKREAVEASIDLLRNKLV